MIKAIIFDFDGVIVDSEPVHLRAFQTILKDLDIDLTEQRYYEEYLAYDDKTFFYKALNDFGKYKGSEQVEEFIVKKSKVFDELIIDNIRIFPGVREFIKSIDSRRYRVAIGSGALREEIVDILNNINLSEYFEFIVSADEVEQCKPNPEVYLKVLENFNINLNNKIKPEECVVIEDAPHGVMAAKSAGMKCIAVTNSKSDTEISGADLVVDSLSELDIHTLNSRI